MYEMVCTFLKQISSKISALYNTKLSQILNLSSIFGSSILETKEIRMTVMRFSMLIIQNRLGAQEKCRTFLLEDLIQETWYDVHNNIPATPITFLAVIVHRHRDLI